MAENKVFEAFELNFIGKTPEEIEKIVSRKISEIGDKFSSEVFGDLIRTYQQVGEGALLTASRLAIDLLSVTDILGMTGKTIVSVSIELSESLIEIAGGLDKLSEAASTYYDKFFSDEEKHLRLQGILTEAMNQMNLPLMETRMGYRALVEAFDLTVEWQKEAYVAMLQLAEAADEYYSTLEETMEEAIRTNEKYIESLKNINLTIQAWLDNLRISDLAPVQSAAEWNRQYAEAKSKASLSTATEKDVSDYLNFASKYLGFQQSYGTSGSYQAIYDAVVGDVEGMQKGKNEALDLAQKQLDALRLIEANTAASAAAEAVKSAEAAVAAADAKAGSAARLAAEAQASADAKAALAAAINAAAINAAAADATYLAWWTANYDSPFQAASGGYSDRPAIFGEAGGEWAVPTYEPQRSSFLKKAPAKFWDNLGLNGGTNGPSGDINVEIPVIIDGQIIETLIAKRINSGGDLRKSVVKAARSVN